MNTNISQNKEAFIRLLQECNRDGMDGVIEDLEKWGFFEAPASAGHHLNVKGGLVLHSLNTCKAGLAIWEGMLKHEPYLDREVPRESVIIATLLHDVCKADIYKESVKRRKTTLGTWEEIQAYKVSYKNFPMGHGEKSVILLLCSGLELTDAEMLAIRWHMGAFGLNLNSYEDQRSFDTARKLYPLVTIVQNADSLAAAILERSAAEIDEL